MEITKIKGISDKREEDFNKLGIFDTSDMVGFFPRTYVDLREKQLLKYVYHNDYALTAAKIIRVPVSRFAGRRFNGLVKAVCEQEGLVFSVVWFNQPYVLNKLVYGEEYLFYGRVHNHDGEIEMINPTFELCDKAYRLKGIVPQYVLKGGLTQKLVRDSVRLAVDLEKPRSIIPFSLQQKYGLINLYEAYRTVHNPENFEKEKIAADRIAVEEYFTMISVFKIIKGDKEQVRVNNYSCSEKDLSEFINGFPFEFTDGQKAAVRDVFSDMSGGKVMNRLLQGDVGSGKTAVSLCAVFTAIKSGYQAVMLSPTEVLANQNYNVVKNAFKDKNVLLLTGSMSAKEKRAVNAAASCGYADVIVGTHAVLENDLEFKNLSLCICDEQQRFGVAQRSALLSKGVATDVLVMSATPIPRTLSLIFYGDLDITTIKDKPKSRLPVQTNIVPSYKYNDMLKFIEKEILSGKQAYFVCPKIEGDEDGSVMSATELFDEIKTKLPSVSVGLLHGKMKDAQKNAVMEDFKSKKIGLLVSTTVIEVGVDVKDASVIVIYNAERFGLSQLHQLRGRVGRSDIKSYCFLTTSATEGIALDRLKIIKDNSDGFKISEYDYKTRGSGDFMGSRQSGKSASDLGYLNFGTEAIFIAKKLSDEAFISGENADEIRAAAMKKFERLKDVVLN